MGEKPQSHSGLVIFPSEYVPSKHPITLKPICQETTNASPLSNLATPLYVLHRGKASEPCAIVQLLRFSSKYGSWLIASSDESIPPDLVKNGDVTFVTIVDPLFIVLTAIPTDVSSNPELARGSSVHHSAVFQPIDAITDLSGTDLSMLLSPSTLRAVCDSKTVDDVEYFRLSSDRALDWLLCKHSALAQISYVGHSHAIELLAQYLTPEWEQKLRSKLTASESTKPGTTDSKDGTEKDLMPEAPMPGSAAEVAMSIMMEEAQLAEVDTATPFTKQNESVGKQSKQTRPKPAPKRDEAAVKFWAKRTTRSSTLGKDNSKRKR